MTLGLIGLIVFAALGFLLFLGGIEQLGPIKDPKILRRIGLACFVIAFLSGLTDSTPTRLATVASPE